MSDQSQKKVVVLAVHGMGDTPKEFANDLWKKLKHSLRRHHDIKEEDIESRAHFDTLYYQDILQTHQAALWKAMKKGKKLGYRDLRKFALYSLSDAVSIERHVHRNNSAYEGVQKKIKNKLKCVFQKYMKDKEENLPVVLIAQSLGAHVISSYIWDAQSKSAARGVWKSGQSGNEGESSAPEKTDDCRLDNFLRLKSLRYFFTTGCNIPVFAAGICPRTVQPIKTKTKDYNFCWINFYDRHDVLGWPLNPLYRNSDQTGWGKQERFKVTDEEVSVGGIISGWTPFCHQHYWKDKDVFIPVAKSIAKFLK